MPNANWGLYLTGADEGTEVSSTYEGRHITTTAAELITDGGSGVAVKGHACVFGLLGLQAVGVCFNSGTTTDLIAIDTEGIWNLPVDGEDDNGNTILRPGSLVYINVASCAISGIRNTATQIPFGYLLTQVASAGSQVVSAVKVHFDPSLDTNDQMFKTVTSGTYNYGKQWVGLLEAGRSNGVACYFAAQVDGLQSGDIYGGGLWIEPQDGYTSIADVMTIWDLGIYCANGAGQDMSNQDIYGIQMTLDIGENPDTIHWIRVNSSAQTGIITAVFHAANPNSVGYIADAVINNANKLGNVPLFNIVGLGVCYVEIFSA